MSWNYKREAGLTEGDHRFEVLSAKEGTSRAGNRMIVVELRPNGSGYIVQDHFVEGPYFNRNITQFFDGTNIEDGNFQLITWKGATGAARFKRNEDGYMRVHYYLPPKRWKDLPDWVGELPERQKITDGFTDVDDEELPF